ncbi:hypothetical protein LguiA_008398 [Lonicera macranthoides]
MQQCCSNRRSRSSPFAAATSSLSSFKLRLLHHNPQHPPPPYFFTLFRKPNHRHSTASSYYNSRLGHSSIVFVGTTIIDAISVGGLVDMGTGAFVRMNSVDMACRNVGESVHGCALKTRYEIDPYMRQALVTQNQFTFARVWNHEELCLGEAKSIVVVILLPCTAAVECALPEGPEVKRKINVQMAVVRAQEPSSSSSSSSTCRSLYTYDVFLSFRGEDTRTNFTDHLYTALVDKGIRTFRDYDEIERGKSLKPELEKAIKESRISLIVFSKNYAISRWCLNELVMILECRKINSRHVVLPIFYDVSPSEVRKQTGTIGEAFDRYKEELEFMEKVNGWRAALKEVADLAGMEFKNQANRCFLLGQEISPALRNEGLDLRTDAFEKMERLRLLKLNYTQLDGRYDNFPKTLIWLCWHGFPSKYIPIELSLENLVALDLRHSKLEEVWAGPKFLGSLKILNLSYSERLAKTPNFLGVPNLEKLILKGCVRLIEICESVEFLEELDLLDLTDCKNLRKLPRNMYKLGSLETLIISGCSALFAGGLDICATSTANGQGRWWCTSLLLLWVPQPCRGPEILWASLPHSLRNLSLAWCNLSDDSLPSAFSNLSRLKYLDLSYNSFCSLPDCIKSLSSLHWLSLHHCRFIDSIVGLPSNLRSLNLKWCDSLRNITFQSNLYQLEEIYRFDCDRCVEVEGILKGEPTGEGSYEFGIVSIFIQGGEIPSCFSERKKRSPLPFTVSSVPKFRVKYLSICSVYAFSGRGVTHDPFAIKINNRTKDLTWVYCPMCYACPKEDEEMTWLSQWNFGNQLEGGDEIVVSVFLSEMFEVKECGIKIAYKDVDNEVVSNENNNNTYFDWNVMNMALAFGVGYSNPSKFYLSIG